MMRADLTDEQWERLEPHLPPRKPKRGRPNCDHRRIVNGILWIARTGAPWRDLPEYYGPWRTVASRFYRWQKAGVWDRVLRTLQSRKDEEGELDWEVHYLDATTVRAHQHAAGAKGGTRRGTPTTARR
jgi:transposase